MSHIVSIKTKVTDPAALAAACRRLGVPEPVHGTATLFAGQQASGLIVQLPGWRYPAVVEPATGEVKFDTYNGAWGSQSELDKLLQRYTVEKTRAEALRAGHTLTEQPLGNGSIKLTIQVGAGAMRGGAA